jgi:DNA-directed RNA polymerase subunit omega
MPDRHPTMMEPPVEDLLDRVDSKFTLVSLAAMRGRQINSYFNQLGEGLGTIVPPQVTSVSRKPLSISLEEIAAGKITYVRTDVEETGEDVDEDDGSGPVGPDARDEAGAPTTLQAAPDTDLLAPPALDTPPPAEPGAESAPGAELGGEAVSLEPVATADPDDDLVVIPEMEPEGPFGQADPGSDLDPSPQMDTGLMEPLGREEDVLRDEWEAEDLSPGGPEADDEPTDWPEAEVVSLGGPVAEDEPMGGPEAEDGP